MKNFWFSIAQGLVVAGIIGTFALLWQMNARISRIETRLGIVANATTTTQHANIP